MVSGTVTNSLTSNGLAGVTVAFDPPVIADLTTDATGAYTTPLPVGVYTVTFTLDQYEEGTETFSVAAGVDTTVDAALAPLAGVVVDAGADLSGAPGSDVSPSASASIFDDSTGATYAWTQVSGVPLTITGGNTATPTVTLPDLATYKTALAGHLEQPDRFMVLGIDPYALEETEIAVLEVTVTTSSGTYTDEVEVIADLGLVHNIGIQNAPLNEGVLLQAVENTSYSWTVTPTTATVDDAASRWPILVATAKGTYTVTETVSGDSMTIFAGNFTGAISGMGADGFPDSSNCTGCHNGTMAPDKFTAWRESGHAEIFTQNINNSAGHWSLSCAGCHGVGYNENADNGGWDEAIATESWTVPHGDPGNFADILTNYPETASLSNIQCENCHGPNDSPGHMGNPERISTSAQVCGSCHGEPARHGRYQQWKESKHSDYTLAISRGGSSHCGRCHTDQGFRTWITQGDLTKNIQGAAGDATAAEMTALGAGPATVHPQTCVTCHDPHMQGRTSGEPNTATVRISGDTDLLPAGFMATGVGNGALCMTCHNTRNGLHNDVTFAGQLMDTRAPHVAAQADVLMGENAFFVTPSQRSPHSFISDSCTNCHMVLTDPPAQFSYNLSGTNHSFEASLEICSDCHGSFDGGSLQAVVAAAMADVETAWTNAMLGHIQNLVADGHSILVTGSHDAGETVTYADFTIDNTNVGNITFVGMAEVHGRNGLILTITGLDAGAQHYFRLNDTNVDASGTDLLTFMPGTYPMGQNLAKAGWNYYLIHGDGSHGVHNPGWVLDVINATKAALTP